MRGVLIVEAEEGSVAFAKSKPNLLQNIKDAVAIFFNNLKRFFFSRQFKLPDSKDFVKFEYKEQEEAIKKLSDNQEGDKAWEYIKNTFKGQAGSSGNIHDLAHLSGKLIYDKKGFDGIALCSAEFAFGCFHGFLDQAFSKNLDHLKDAETACLKLGTNQSVSGPAASCIHGIGHGVASFHSTADLKASLSACRKLIFGRQYCFDGVFMEFVRSAPDNFFKAEDPLYPCNFLEAEFGPIYSAACGRNQPPLLMSRFKKGFEEVAGICESSESKPLKQACFNALGFSLAASLDVSQIITGCHAIGEEEYVLECTKAAAGELIFQEAPGWDEKSKQICASISAANECLEYLDRLVSEYKRVRKIKFTPLQSNEDPNNYIRKQMQVCYEINGRDGCYKQVAQLFFDQLGFSQTFQLLKANEKYPEVYARCHEATHYLSRLELDRQKSISKVYAQCDSTCHGGCYHGTLEAYLKNEQEKKDFKLSERFATVCGKQSDYQKPFEFNECLHGMGHAAMFITDMELLESLNLCDTIPRIDHRERCYTGVFMENSSSSTSFDHQSKYIKRDDPYYPCNTLEEKYLSLCWQYQSSYFALINNQDWGMVASMCLQIPQAYQDRCFRSIGTNQVGFTQSLNLMRDDCEMMPTEHFQDVCVGGVISSFAYRFVGDTQKMTDFCDLVSSNHQETCFKQMGTAFLEWTVDKNQALATCKQISDPQGAAWCISVI